MNKITKICFGALMSLAYSLLPGQAATIQLTVGGYFGGNTLADNVTVLPDATLVDFGIFYKNSAFTSLADIRTAVEAANTDAKLQSLLTDNGWYSFGTSTVAGGTGDFTLSWQPNDTSAGPGFGSSFNIDPLIGGSSINLVGKIGFVWLKTPTNTPGGIQYGLFASNTSFPASGFGAELSVDMVDTGDAASGVTALLGKVTDSGVKTATLAAGGVPNIATPTLRLITAGVPVYRNGKTTVTHTFAVSANGSYVLEYKSSLTDTWRTTSLTVANSNSFDVTFDNPGVDSTTDWTNRMFFRIKNG